MAVAVLLTCMALPAGSAPKDKGSWTIQTADTKLTIGLRDGKPIITSLSAASRGERKWLFIHQLMGVPEAALPSTVEIDGKSQKVAWAFKGVTPGKSKIAVVYRCASPDLELVSIWESASLPGPVEHRVIISNRDRRAVTLAPPATISIPLAFQSDRTVDLWWVEKGAGRPSKEGTHVEKVAEGFTRSLLSGPYSENGPDRDAIPWFNLHDEAAGAGVYGGIEFTGWTEVSIRKNKSAVVDVSLGLDPRGGASRTSIKPGGSLSLPTCFIGVYTGSVDDGCNKLHRWVEKHLRPAIPGGVTPILVNNSWGSGMGVTESLTKTMIDECADLGMEIYHVDAGWFKGVGDWHINPGKFPNGLAKTSDYARSKGLRFGLWTGWTQGGAARDAGPDVMSVFNPEQKSWFGHDYPDDWRTGPFTGATCCLGCKEARDWSLRELRRMVKEYKLDLLEHDQQMVLADCGREGHGHIPGDTMDTSRAAANGYYAVYDQLRKENPGLLFEDCVNGGRMVDFGAAKRAHYICATDAYDPWSLRASFYDASFPLPASMLEAYIANHPGSTLANFKFMLRSGMMGWCTIMLDTSKWTPEQREAGKKEFARYKQQLRPFIANGNLYHVLPRPDRMVWDGVQYVDPKSGNAVLYVFRPKSDESTRIIPLRGLVPTKQYKVEAADGSCSGTYTGVELMAVGLKVSLPEQDSSDIVFLNVVR